MPGRTGALAALYARATEDHDCRRAGCKPHVCGPKTAKTIRNIHRILPGAFATAKRWEWIAWNPAGAGDSAWLSLVVAGRDVLPDRDVVIPAAAWLARGPVETGDVGLEIDDRCPVEKVDTGEPYGRAGHVQELDDAEPDGVDPPRAASGEQAHLALLASQQERHLPERRVAAGIGRLVQPAQQPDVVPGRTPPP
jgi:hypothetical protein